MKPALWLGSSKADLKTLPESVQDEAGHQLLLVQCGREPSDWKPMKTIGPGVRELRIREAAGAFRVIYLATRPEGVYVLHVFQKKTAATRPQDIRLAQERFKAVRS